MTTLQKIGGIVFTKDPEGNYRLLLRHNRPFNGHLDHWTILSGTIDEGETAQQAMLREIEEEFSITSYDEVIDLEYSCDLPVKGELWQIAYYAVRVPDIGIKIVLEWESIGYDWVTIDEAKKIIKEDFVITAVARLEELLKDS